MLYKENILTPLIDLLCVITSASMTNPLHPLELTDCLRTLLFNFKHVKILARSSSHTEQQESLMETYLSENPA